MDEELIGPPRNQTNPESGTLSETPRKTSLRNFWRKGTPAKVVTSFRTKQASTKDELALDLPALAALIKRTRAKRKEDLPGLTARRESFRRSSRLTSPDTVD